VEMVARWVGTVGRGVVVVMVVVVGAAAAAMEA
jgi:hypothetical protein